MNVSMTGSFGSITNGDSALTGARMQSEHLSFINMINELHEKKSTVASSQILESGKLNGDIASGFTGSFSAASDKNAAVKGAAANQGGTADSSRKIDKTSRLYEKSMELEGYFVKQMLSSMRKTVSKSGLGGNDFAGQMYEDMLYDEYSSSMTKNAGFGLADQIYLSLVK